MVKPGLGIPKCGIQGVTALSGNKRGIIPAFNIMAKPAGAACNLDCAYCFYKNKTRLYPDSSFRMSDKVLENYIRQTMEAHLLPEVTIGWQGGEPTLMGLDFFKRAVELEKKFMRPGMHIENTFQTNGILIDREWCRFFRENNFLVGVSIDGPKNLHDAYRRDKGGNGTFDQVWAAVRLMQEYNVEFNVLCTVNSVNSPHPLEVYRFFRDSLGTAYLQFIPIVERSHESGNESECPPGQSPSPTFFQITERSVGGVAWGNFLIEIFNEWIRRDVGKVFVLYFDAVLASYMYGHSTSCVLQPTCGLGVVLEHNGDLYSCDHYVAPEYHLGNIMQDSIQTLLNSEKQKSFGRDKTKMLPQYCRKCEFLFTCHGECPKNRVLATPDGEQGLNWLCEGYKAFFAHTRGYMEAMAALLRSGKTADEIMGMLDVNGNPGLP